MPALDFNMPPKKDKKSATSSDNSGSTGDIHIPDACESTLGESQPVSTKTTRSASLTTDSSLMDVLRNELRELKSGIQEKLDLVINNQQSLLTRMDNMESRHREMEKSVSYTSEAMDEIQQENNKLRYEMAKTSVQLEESHQKAAQLEVSVLNMERYSRSYNLRFGGIPELPNESPEYPYEKIKEILAEKCNLSPKIENAHRSGHPSGSPNDKPRHILAKFIYRPERQAILLRAKSTLAKHGIYVVQDLPAADIKTKRSLKEVMHKAYKSGHKTVFRNGTLFINGQRYSPPPPNPNSSRRE